MAIREAVAFSEATAKRCDLGGACTSAPASASVEAGGGGEVFGGRAVTAVGTVAGGGSPQPAGNAPRSRNPARSVVRVEDRAALDRTRLLGCALRSTGGNPVGLEGGR